MKTNKTYLLILFLLISYGLEAQNNLSALIPMPNKIEEVKSDKKFQVSTKTQIIYNDNNLGFETDYLKGLIQTNFSLDLKSSKSEKTSSNSIMLFIDESIQHPEEYKLQISDKNIQITGATKGAIYYGILTLEQILMGDIFNTKFGQIAQIKIEDKPVIKQRILMLDPARHFLPKEDVMFYINIMSKYKYNTLQLHLTDDQGWRIEIPNYPELTEKGAIRKEGASMNGPDNGFYTRQDLKEIIAYAALRNIEVVPELDIPGHTVALLKAYPHMACTHQRDAAMDMGKITNNFMLCASNEYVYDAYRDIIKEVADIFPSKKIHFGGDESVIKDNWAICENCRETMHELGYEKASDLMINFFDRMLGYASSHGKDAILWFELNSIYPPAHSPLFPYPKGVTLVTWRNGLTPTCIDLSKKSGHDLILAPGEYAYFDYPQYKNDFPEFNNWGMPTITLEKAYQFDPAYGADEIENHIVGVMGTLWSEAIKDINRATYMTYPRGLALVEAGWTKRENRDWDSFKKRLMPNLNKLMNDGVSIRVPFEIIER